MGPRSHLTQFRHDADAGPELQRPQRTGRRLPLHGERRLAKRRYGASTHRRRYRRASSLYSPPARSRPGRAHQRGNAPEQFLAVAIGLRRNLRHAHTLARFSRPTSARRHRRISKTRTPLWRLESRGTCRTSPREERQIAAAADKKHNHKGAKVHEGSITGFASGFLRVTSRPSWFKLGRVAIPNFPCSNESPQPSF